MECISCKSFEFLKDEQKEIYGYCHKKATKVSPYDECLSNKKGAKENRAAQIYIDNYKTKTLDEIAKMIGRNWNKARLNYLIEKKFLPRKLWEKQTKKKEIKRNQIK